MQMVEIRPVGRLLEDWRIIACTNEMESLLTYLDTNNTHHQTGPCPPLRSLDRTRISRDQRHAERGSRTFY